jgi:hypothetical protein
MFTRKKFGDRNEGDRFQAMASKHKLIQCSPQKKFQSGTKIVGFSQRM